MKTEQSPEPHSKKHTYGSNISSTHGGSTQKGKARARQSGSRNAISSNPSATVQYMKTSAGAGSYVSSGGYQQSSNQYLSKNNLQLPLAEHQLTFDEQVSRQYQTTGGLASS